MSLRGEKGSINNHKCRHVHPYTQNMCIYVEFWIKLEGEKQKKQYQNNESFVALTIWRKTHPEINKNIPYITFHPRLSWDLTLLLLLLAEKWHHCGILGCCFTLWTCFESPYVQTRINLSCWFPWPIPEYHISR